MPTASALPLPKPAASASTSRRPAWLRRLHAQHSALAWAGWLNAALALTALLLWPLDERMVTGLNVWIKPLKFGASGLIYLWTVAWLLADVPATGQRSARRLGRVVALSMAVEILVIFLQAARGTTSHFNVGSAFDGAMFGLMGWFILLNTLGIVAIIGLVFWHRPQGSEAWAWGVRLGLVFFLVGSAVGGTMIRQFGHTVGAADGGPGLPFLGWSTRHGDLRAAHFLGLHALQVLPLAGWLIGRRLPGLRPLAQGVAVALAAALYAAAVAALYYRALSGQPLLGW